MGPADSMFKSGVYVSIWLSVEGTRRGSFLSLLEEKRGQMVRVTPISWVVTKEEKEKPTLNFWTILPLRQNQMDKNKQNTTYASNKCNKLAFRIMGLIFL